VGIIALATFGGRVIFDTLVVDDFFIFIIGAVVEVPQSVQRSLYSASLRPHFRQNGICSL